MSHPSDVAPLPDALEARNELHSARSRAVDALLEAEDLEAQARRARRQATARLKHYERLLQEHQGQLKLWEKP